MEQFKAYMNSLTLQVTLQTRLSKQAESLYFDFETSEIIEITDHKKDDMSFLRCSAMPNSGLKYRFVLTHNIF